MKDGFYNTGVVESFESSGQGNSVDEPHRGTETVPHHTKLVLPFLECSRILDVLGQDLFVPVRAMQVPGRVIWCNFELARQLGFPVPRSNTMSPTLHSLLIKAFSWRTLRPKEDAGERPVCTLYADRYGGDGVGPALGSGRSSFTPWCNACIKGAGYTPLFRHDDPDDFVHSHGGLDLYQALGEAVFGEVDTHLFTHRSTRILSIIDQDDYTVRPSGRRTPRAIAIRVGDQLRPAHIMARKTRWDRRSRFDVFVSSTRETNQLVMQESGIPDVLRTMMRIIDDHACTAAEQTRWRMTHCHLTPSNMRLDGGMLDLNTQRANPRCGPAAPNCKVASEKSRWPDYIDRVNSLNWFYAALRRSLPEDMRRKFNALHLRLRPAMEAAYKKHLERELLCAAGLKSQLVGRIQRDYSQIAQRFSAVLVRMTSLTNPASVQRTRRVIEESATLDVMNLLAVYSRHYAVREAVNLKSIAHKSLHPIYRGTQRHINSRRAEVKALVPEFIEAYALLMECCNKHALEYYGSHAAMRHSIAARAAFENSPIDQLFRTAYHKEFQRAAWQYKRTGNPEIIRNLVDRNTALSLRKVEALLNQGSRRCLPDGGWELEIRVIQGLRLSVRAPGTSTTKMHLAAAITPELAESLKLTPAQISRLRCFYTTDNWKTSAVVAARLENTGKLQANITFCCFGKIRPIGQWQCRLFGAGSNGRRRELPEGRFQGYVYALPDQIDLKDFCKEDCT